MAKAVKRKNVPKRRFVENLISTKPKCDGSYPGWQFSFTLVEGSGVTRKEVRIVAEAFLPGKLDGGKIYGRGRKVTVKVLAERYMDVPPGLELFRKWLRGRRLFMPAHS